MHKNKKVYFEGAKSLGYILPDSAMLINRVDETHANRVASVFHHQPKTFPDISSKHRMF